MSLKLDWAGSLGQMWASKVEAHDRLLGPIGDAGIAALGDIAGKRILDIGCGAGTTSIAMAKAGATVVGWANLREQLVTGGKAVVVCWREAAQNEWAVLPLQAVASVLGEARTKPSPSGVPGPFAWAEEHVLGRYYTNPVGHSRRTGSMAAWQ